MVDKTLARGEDVSDAHAKKPLTCGTVHTQYTVYGGTSLASKAFFASEATPYLFRVETIPLSARQRTQASLA
jgi:hypothetical protein